MISDLYITRPNFYFLETKSFHATLRMVAVILIFYTLKLCIFLWSW